ncbi:Nn.00g054280.m01.CDS01 [Neocucurbitaria sp. VM-36]
MAKATADTTKGVRMFGADIVAAILALSGTTSLSKETYELMSSVDGTKTADSFQHSFREVMAKAKDLRKRMADGETFTPVQPKKKGTGMASPATPRKRKTPGTSDEDDTPSREKNPTPSKKQTPAKKNATPKGRGEEVDSPVDEPTNGFGDEVLPQDANDFIKMEQVWEQEYA